ncbi:hypothetical protein D6833_12690, partial [Candidatus Parcubacteria bacterium]
TWKADAADLGDAIPRDDDVDGSKGRRAGAVDECAPTQDQVRKRALPFCTRWSFGNRARPRLCRQRV